jgi:hypothetical protein
MKNQRKHKFKYVDPQLKNISENREDLPEKDLSTKLPQSAQIDLKRTAIAISVFTTIIILLYLFKGQLRLNEVLNILN